MTRAPSFLGTVQDVEGATVSVVLDDETGSGLLFIDGHPYRVGQVGSFVRIPLGFTNLLGVVSQAGAGAVPEHLELTSPFGRRWIRVQLVGESSVRNGFSRGVSLLPSIGDSAHVVTSEQLASVYGSVESASRIRLGKIASAESIPALIDINALLTRHSAVIGATGAGKSTCVVQVLRAITDPGKYPSARVLLFDIHGEYSTALVDRATVFSVRSDGAPGRSLVVPYWALSFDELVPLTFGSLPDDASKGAIRDEIVELKRSALERYPRPGVAPQQITVDTPVPFSIHELWFRLHRLVNSTHSVSGIGQSNETEALVVDAEGNPIQRGDALLVIPPRYQPASQASGETKVFLSSSSLNIRRQIDGLASRLKDPRFSFLFRPGAWLPQVDGDVASDLDEWLMQWVGGEAPVAILDLSGVPSSVLTDLIGALIRVIYDALFWSRSLSEGGRERPLLMVFEEAHAYLSELRTPLAASAIQRVVKEGRKYGIGAMVVSQRPSEVDSTVLSQCGTLVAMRLSNSADRSHVVGAVSDNLSGLVSMLPILRTGETIILGEAVPLPMRALVDLPDQLPDSADPVVVGVDRPGGWDRSREPTDYADVVQRWRTQNPKSAKAVETNPSNLPEDRE